MRFVSYTLTLRFSDMVLSTFGALDAVRQCPFAFKQILNRKKKNGNILFLDLAVPAALCYSGLLGYSSSGRTPFFLDLD
jgi:hypothetical protein